MLRIIPPKAKASYNLYKEFNLFDLSIMTIDILLIGLIFSTILPFVVKIIIGVVILAIGLSLVVSLSGGKKGYDYFKNMIQFLIRKKETPQADLKEELKVEFKEKTVF